MAKFKGRITPKELRYLVDQDTNAWHDLERWLNKQELDIGFILEEDNPQLANKVLEKYIKANYKQIKSRTKKFNI